MSVLLEFAMFPTDHGESKSAYVSRVIDLVTQSGYPYRLTPMGTIVETKTVAEALGVIEQSYAALEPDCNRVYVTAKLDIRKGKEDRMKGKLESVQKALGREIEGL